MVKKEQELLSLERKERLNPAGGEENKPGSPERLENVPRARWDWDCQ
jgi:hypothetical protein